jgi:hypothetical protein
MEASFFLGYTEVEKIDSQIDSHKEIGVFSVKKERILLPMFSFLMKELQLNHLFQKCHMNINKEY